MDNPAGTPIEKPDTPGPVSRGARQMRIPYRPHVTQGPRAIEKGSGSSFTNRGNDRRMRPQLPKNAKRLEAIRLEIARLQAAEEELTQEDGSSPSVTPTEDLQRSKPPKTKTELVLSALQDDHYDGETDIYGPFIVKNSRMRLEAGAGPEITILTQGLDNSVINDGISTMTLANLAFLQRDVRLARLCLERMAL
jgi:hypothetical protein